MSSFFSKLIILYLIIFNFSGCLDSKQEFYKLDCGNGEAVQVKHTEENEGEVLCTRTALIFNMNIDGVFIEPSDKIVEKCVEILNQKDFSNKHCENMTSPGAKTSFIISIGPANHMLKNGFNPVGKGLDRRIELAKEKLLDTFEESREELNY